MTDSIGIDRRQFAGQLAAGSSAIVALMGGAISSAQGEPTAQQDAATPKAKPEPAEQPALEDLLLAYVVLRYPSDKYDGAALRMIRSDLRADIARGKMLSEFPLKNSDEPAFVFRSYRGPD